VPYLVLALECDRPTSGSARYSLEAVDCVTIGRGEARAATRRSERGAVTIDLRVPAPAMSAQHARITRLADAWVIEDAGSRNGTFVHGARVERAIVRERDIVAMGRALFFVTPPIMTPPTAPDDCDAAGISTARGHVTLDPAFDAELEAALRVAKSDLSVLILGESGTGKEVLARAVHAGSNRGGPFVAVNCGAIPAGLVEAQLFGHVKGAFSGAVRDEPGLFRAADKGTLFLDEVGDLPAAAQVALLRALQEREALPVGGTRPVKIDLRVLAATHQEIEARSARGEFRRDLLARLAGFTITLPSLRARPWDVGILVASLLGRLSANADSVRITPEAGEALLRYAWPLNTRELEQCLARALALSQGEAIDVVHLPPALTEPKPTEDAPSGLSERDERLRLELLTQLARHDGNIAEVARAMGRARMQVHRWCRRFGIDPNRYRID
jgi:DNA-binding NtrC family response regulator